VVTGPAWTGEKGTVGEAARAAVRGIRERSERKETETSTEEIPGRNRMIAVLLSG
jgi:hypothetical protein